MAGVIELVLERDGHDQPWGFRLQGGSDLGMPLSIQRVLVGTPAEGALHRGDIITKISCTETKNITHQQAVDLFNSAGNQITVQLKRAGVQPAPVASAPISVPLVNGSPVQAPVPVPVSGGVPLPGIANTTLARPENPAVKALPKTQFSLKSHFARQQQQKSAPPNLDTLSIQSQTQTNLVAAASAPLSSGLVSKQYNSPLPLYSQENVQEVIRMQASPGANPGHPSSNTNKPVQVILNPSKEYNPQSSATWRALQESDTPPVDLEKIANYSSLKEHDPIYSEVYAAPTAPKPGQRPPPKTNAQPGPRSPVAEFLPSALRPAEPQITPNDNVVSSQKSSASAVLSATLAESKPINHQMTQDPVKIPMYETNSIGGRKRIAQTASFNKLMMDVLGE